MATVEPKLILLFSGKRKSGKYYVTLGPGVCCILRLSGPLKQQYAQVGISVQLSGEYEEKYRADMIQWGEKQREKDPGFFCRVAIKAAQQPIWIVSDTRHLSDLQWFWRNYPSQSRCVRVEASEETRRERDWEFTTGAIPTPISECGLDQGVDFDWIIKNEGDGSQLEEQLATGLLSIAKEKVKED
uniref:Phosphomevalonate kinase n=1 Tax=Oncorhynchus mykiss TaxID=8022 RepID=A0A8C7UZ78_ONCMY